jgi:hypothetical protein
VKNQAHCQEGRTIKRFFFNIREGDELIEDPDGTLLLDLTSAISEANGAARELLAAQIRNGRSVDGRSIEIADETRTVVAVIALRSGGPMSVLIPLSFENARL